MRLRIHHPLFAGFLGVVGLQVALIVFLVGSGLRRDLRETFEDELGRHLTMGAALFSATPVADPDSLARVITERIDYRVTINDLEGTVLGDSYVAPERLGLTRPS